MEQHPLRGRENQGAPALSNAGEQKLPGLGFVRAGLGGILQEGIQDVTADQLAVEPLVGIGKSESETDWTLLSHDACDDWYKVTNYPESHDEVGNVPDRISYVAGSWC